MKALSKGFVNDEWLCVGVVAFTQGCSLCVKFATVGVNDRVNDYFDEYLLENMVFGFTDLLE